MHASNSETARAYQASQDNLLALQRMQEQTASLHQQFLEGQQAALQTFQMLMQQQQQFLGGGAAQAVQPVVFGGQGTAGTQRTAGTQAPEHAQAKPGTPVDGAGQRPLGTPDAPDAETSRLSGSFALPDESASMASMKSIEAALLSTVAEKTGYPVEMLELDMSLDADLGIDSIKRVEILSALREDLPEAPEIGPEHLGTLQSLRQIVAFLAAGMGGGAEGVHGAPGTLGAETNRLSGSFALPAEGASMASIEAALLSTVAEKTGYPVEMLELDMSLDADLGIDSIKRVEILSALREALPEAPEIGPEHLGTLQSLRQIVAFLAAGMGGGGEGTRETPGASGAETNRLSGSFALPEETASLQSIEAALLSTVAEKTGYPVEMLELDMSLDADLGIDSIKRVEILSALREALPEAPEIGPEHLGTLQSLRQIVAFLAAGMGGGAEGTQGDSTLQGAPDAPGAETNRLSGSFALPEEGASTPSIERTVERLVLSCAPLNAEREAVAVNTGHPVWLAGGEAPLAEALEAALRDRGCQVEHGTLEALRARAVPAQLAGLVVLAPEADADDAFLLEAFRLVQAAAPALRQTPDAFLMTVSRMDGCFGLAGGADFAPASGGLAGLAKTAQHEWPEVRSQAVDLAQGLPPQVAGAALAEEIFSSGPVEVGIGTAGRVWLQLSPAALPEAAEGPLAPGEVVVITGGARGVTAEVAVALARSFQPRIVLLGRSAAPQAEPAWLVGLEEEREIKQALMAQGTSTPREIAEQYAAIEAGREITRNIARMEAAGAGVDYRSVDIRDAAQVVECLAELRAAHGPICGLVHGAGVLADKLIEDKTEEQFRRVYNTKVLGLRALLDATADDPLKALVLFSSSTGRYGRKGQADYAIANEVLNKTAQVEARRRPGCRVVAVNWGPWEGGMVTPGLARLFEEEGVGLIDLQVGADYLVREMAETAERPVEVVVLGFPIPGQPASPAAPRIEALPTAYTLELSVAEHPFLRSHVLKGHAVLPAAMMLEWLGHAAMHAHPGLRFHGVAELRVLKGVRLAPEAQASLRFAAGKLAADGDYFRVPVSLHSPGAAGEFLHATAEVLLGNQAPGAPAGWQPRAALLSSDTTANGWYQDGRLFHGPHFQGIQALHLDGTRFEARVAAAPLPAAWIARPLRQRWLADPLVLDSVFQAAILWSIAQYDAPSLPSRIGAYHQFAAFPEEGARVLGSVRRHSPHHGVADVDLVHPTEDRLIARMTDYEFTIDPALHAAFQWNSLEQPAAG